VRVVTHENFGAFVARHGLEIWPIEGDVQKIAQSERMRILIERGHFLRLLSQMAKEAQQAAIQLAKAGLEACQGMDLILGGMGGVHIGISLAEKQRIPFLQAHLVPFTPTVEFASVLLPSQSLRVPRNLNRLSHHITRQIMWQSFRSADGIAREQVLGIQPAPFWGPYRSDRTKGFPVLYGYSSSVVPKPRDWAEDHHLTGYWFLEPPAEWTPPSSLMAFLEDGSPPIYIGFGSLGNRKPEETVDVILRALERVQCRAVLLSGWGGLRKVDLPDTVLMIDSAPHAWLFPRVAVVVHHGGAGTTAAGLRAGIPSVVIPFFGDQPFWGHRIWRLGVGPKPIPRKQLTDENLASAIGIALSDQAMRDRASELGSTLQAEDGISRAIEIIHAAWD
jgi:UDP:flavonoid glycosyltransferase YjiC (YdhE family)